MTNIRFVVGTLLFVASAQAVAQAPIYLGGGTAKCSQVVQDYDKNKQAEIVYWTWAQGYMSGINRVLDESKAGTRDLSTSRPASLISYCREHPTSFFIDAVDKLFAGLPLTKGAAASPQR